MSGFATTTQARRTGRPKRVHFIVDRQVHLLLLPTLAYANAVTVSFRVGERIPREDSNLSSQSPSRAHVAELFRVPALGQLSSNKLSSPISHRSGDWTDRNFMINTLCDLYLVFFFRRDYFYKISIEQTVAFAEIYY